MRFLLPGIFGTIALAFFIVAGVFLADTYPLLSDSVKAEGTVVQLVAKRSVQSKTRRMTYSPRVKFTDNDKAYTFVSVISSNPPGYQQGEKVEVIYAPGAPRDARINSFFSLWGFIIIFGGIALLMLILAVFFLIASRRKAT